MSIILQTTLSSVSDLWEACLSSSCENGASCVIVNVDKFICVCKDGFSGVTCGDSDPSSPVSCVFLSN